jgi:ABC-type multidrug transport system fused ATPase/permease subunit
VKEKTLDIVEQRMEAEEYHGERDSWVRRSVVDGAIQTPLRYIASVGVFAYKGMWFLRQGGALFNIVALVCFFAVFFGALFVGNQLLVAAFGLPAGLFFFISIFTHALTRYTAPITPFVIISVLWLLTALARKAFGTRTLQEIVNRSERRTTERAQAVDEQPSRVGS